MNEYDYPKQWGKDSFNKGVKKSDCPISSRTNANALCLWLQGWNEAAAILKGRQDKGANDDI